MPLPMPLPENLRQRCLNLMDRIDAFGSHESLTSIITNAQEIANYAPELPEATNRRDRVNRTIAFFHDKYTENGWAFIFFLHVLKEQIPEGDLRRQELQEIITQASIIPINLDQEREYTKTANEVILEDATTPTAQNLELENWFEIARAAGVDELAFRIALLVLHGADYKAFSNAYKSLAAILQSSFPNSDSELRTNGGKAMPIPEGRRLSIAKARRMEKQITINSGSVTEQITIQIVELCEPAFQSPALHYFWCEYSFCRDEIVEWLNSLAVGQTADVRVRVAIAVGIMAINDFAGIRDLIFNRWAQSDEQAAEYRAAVGRALGIVVKDKQRINEVAALLRLWTASNRYLLQWTAARAYLYVGLLLQTGEAIKQWKSILYSEPLFLYSTKSNLVNINRMVLSLIDAMRRFFYTASITPEKSSETFQNAIFELKVWIAEDKKLKRPVQHGLLVFIMLMRINQAEKEEPNGNSPLLLSLFDINNSESEYRRSLTEVFHQAIRNEDTHGVVRDQIKQWIDLIDCGANCGSQLRVLLQDTIKRDLPNTRLHKLIIYYLEKWQQSPASSVNTARQILKSLT